MNPADDDTVPLPPTVKVDSIHPISAALLRESNKVNEKHGLLPPIRVKDPSDPSVAGGVADLQDFFKEALTPTEVDFFGKPVPLKAPSGPPKNFLQAHTVIIDQLLMDPGITTTRLAKETGYSRNWLQKVMQSDAFQAKLAERQKALCDPIVYNTIAARLSGLTSRSLEILEERLESEEVSTATALEVFGVLSKASGMGVQKPQQQNNFLIHVPAIMPNAVDWATAHGGGQLKVAEPIDITPNGATEGDGNGNE